MRRFYRKLLLSLSLVLITNSYVSFSSTDPLQNSVDYFSKRFETSSIYEKIVNNYGNGFEDLYGTRNVRVVLDGYYYRGGANNYYHRDSPRDNRNPLPSDGLINLCEEGFGEAVYLYSTRAGTAPKSVSCLDRKGQENTIKYQSLPYHEPSNNYELLKLVYEKLKTGDFKPIYAHCWNGWHATGLLASLSLRQFCGFSGEDAVTYWIENADGTADDPNSYVHIKERIQNFKVIEEFKISKKVENLLCQTARL